MDKYIFKDGKISIAKDELSVTTTSTSEIEVACLVKLQTNDQSPTKTNTPAKENNNEQQK